MKRMIILLLGMLFLFGTSAAVFATEPTPAGNAPAMTAPGEMAAPAEAAPAPVKKSLHKAKTVHARVTHMRTYGKVTEVTDTSLKIERTVKGTAETMEFSLKKPVKVKTGEMATIRYIEKDGKNLAIRVMKAGTRHIRHKKVKKL